MRSSYRPLAVLLATPLLALLPMTTRAGGPAADTSCGSDRWG